MEFRKIAIATRLRAIDCGTHIKNMRNRSPHICAARHQTSQKHGRLALRLFPTPSFLSQALLLAHYATRCNALRLLWKCSSPPDAQRERERERDLVRLRFVPGESVKPPTSKMTKIMHWIMSSIEVLRRALWSVSISSNIPILLSLFVLHPNTCFPVK